MRQLGCVVGIVLAALLVRCVWSAEDPTEGIPGVQDLTVDTFDSVVNGKKHALVEFYAPWCGHCIRLTPEYKKLGELISSDPKLAARVTIAKVNADDQKAVGQRFGISGFPTLKWFPRGKAVGSPEDYSGARNADAFMTFIKKALEEDKGHGRVEVIDTIIQSFLKSEDKSSVIKTVEEKVPELESEDAKKAEVYLKIMRKTVEKGDDYISKEHARVSKLVESGSMHQDKVDELSIKISILSAFTSEQ